MNVFRSSEMRQMCVSIANNIQEHHPDLTHISSEARSFVHKGIQLREAEEYCEDIKLDNDLTETFLNILNSRQIVRQMCVSIAKTVQASHPDLTRISSQAQCFVHTGIPLNSVEGYCDSLNLDTDLRDKFLQIFNSDNEIIEKYYDLNPNSGYTFTLVKKQANGLKFDFATVTFKTSLFQSSAQCEIQGSDPIHVTVANNQLDCYRYAAYKELKNKNIPDLGTYFKL